MTPSEEFVERRRFKRYQVKPGAFAALRPDLNKMGQIIDFGKDGLSFLYIHKDDAFNDSSELDIFVSGQEFYLSRLPVKTVSDTNVPNKIPINPIVIQRQGVQFRELTPEQTSVLDSFMLRYTTEEV